MRKLIVATVALLPCLAQQAPVGDAGVITGTVRGEDGSSVTGAYVTLHLSFISRPALRQRLQTQWGLYSGPDGSFRFSGLGVGTYRLCVQAPRTVWLDPCEWGFAVPSVTLTSAQRSQSITVPLRKGVEVPIRIDDASQVLLQSEGRIAGAHLLVGVRTPASTFRPAVLASQEAAGRTLHVVIPFDKPVHVEVASSFFKLADSSGAAFSRPGTAIPVMIPAGQKAPTIRLSVTGRN